MMKLNDNGENLHIRELLEKYLSGCTSVQEEEILRRVLTQSASLSKEYAAVWVMLNGACNVRKLHAKQHKRISLRKIWIWTPVGVAAMLTLIIAFSSLHTSSNIYGMENGVKITSKTKAVQLAEDAFNEVIYDSSNTINDVL